MSLSDRLRPLHRAHVATLADLSTMRVDWPEERRGPWSIERFEVTPESTHRDWYGDRAPEPGIYTKLMHDDLGPVMSDTTAELIDAAEPLYQARGRVLVNGLGLGSFIKGCLAKPEVTHIDVVEIDADVIALTGQHFDDPRVTIHHADAYKVRWPLSTRWDLAWHDIWPTIAEANLAEMRALRRKYRKRVDHQYCWCEYESRTTEEAFFQQFISRLGLNSDTVTICKIDPTTT